MNWLQRWHSCQTQSPWYDLRGWLGFKNQLSIYLVKLTLLCGTVWGSHIIHTNRYSLPLSIYSNFSFFTGETILKAPPNDMRKLLSLSLSLSLSLCGSSVKKKICWSDILWIIYLTTGCSDTFVFFSVIYHVYIDQYMWGSQWHFLHAFKWGFSSPDLSVPTQRSVAGG